MLESSKVPALTRAIDILNLIARIGPCSAAIIIETLRIPKSTAYLLLNELKRLRRGDLFKITVIRRDLTEFVVIQGDRRKRLSR